MVVIVERSFDIHPNYEYQLLYPRVASSYSRVALVASERVEKKEADWKELPSIIKKKRKTKQSKEEEKTESSNSHIYIKQTSNTLPSILTYNDDS